MLKFQGELRKIGKNVNKSRKNVDKILRKYRYVNFEKIYKQRLLQKKLGSSAESRIVQSIGHV